MTDTTFKDAQQQVDSWIKGIGADYFSELGCLAVLTEEVGEVARVVSRQYGEQVRKTSDTELSLSDELGDVLFSVMCLANKTGIDLGAAFEANMAKKTNRDSTRYNNNEKLAS